MLLLEHALFVCIWSRCLKLYLRKWSLIQMLLKKHLVYNLNWSCFVHTVACTNITMPRCVTAACRCKIIEKSVIGESSFLSCETWSSTWFSIAGSVNHESSRELRLAMDCQLTFERYCIYIYTWMKKCCLLSIYSNKLCGTYFIFHVSSVAVIRGRRLFKRLIPQRQNILIVQFNLLHEYFHGSPAWS